MSSPYDTPQVLVIGAGPAGAMVGLQLARAGIGVLLVDKAVWPREKVCGGCLNHEALAALDDVDAGDLIKCAGGQTLRTFRVAAGHRHASLKLPRSVAVSRRRLDAALVQRFVASGGRFASGVSARVTSSEPPVAQLRSDSRCDTVRPTLMIVADGLGGRAAPTSTTPVRGSRMGAGAVLEGGGGAFDPGAIHMAIGRGGYVGVVRLAGDCIDVAGAFDVGFVRACGSPGAAVEALLRDAAMPSIDGIAEADWRGTPLLTRKPIEVAHGAVFTVGDAAGYAEPFTGEGIAWAFRSAQALAPIATSAAVGVDETHRSAWRRAHRSITAVQHRRCQLLARGLRSPFVAAAMITALAAIPALHEPAFRWLAGGRAGVDATATAT